MMRSGPEQQAGAQGETDQRGQESSMRNAAPVSFHPLPADIIDVSSSASSNSSDDSLVSAPAPRVPSKRSGGHKTQPVKCKKTAPHASPSAAVASFCAGQYGNAEQIKAKLKQLHPQCVPRVRSTCGPEKRHIRFNCKNEKVPPHFCTLNVSCIKTVRSCGTSWINPSIDSYRPGSCGMIICHNCDEVLATGHFTCVAGHKLCNGCFNSMVGTPPHTAVKQTCNMHLQVKTQLIGERKTVFDKISAVNCLFCQPATPLTLRNHAHLVQDDIWSVYCDAITEKAVIAVQQAQAHQQPAVLVPVSENPVDQAIEHARTLVLPKCPKCKNVIADFDACAAITCGALCITQDGVQGCGTRLCAWCLRICQAHDHSMHVAWCELNPRQGQVFPQNIDAWHEVQFHQARMRMLKFIATLPKGVSTEVRRAVAAEFPRLGFPLDGYLNPAGDLEEGADSSVDRHHLRPQPPPPQRHFLENIQVIVDMGIASRARAQQVLEGTQNDLNEALGLLLAAAGSS